jgi:hypothetical protein
MPPPTPTFAKLSAAAQPKIDIQSKPQQHQFLADSGIPAPPTTPAKELNERCAALAWAHTSLASAEDPDSWLTTLDVALHPTLLGLYLLPPHRGPGAPPSNFARLAKTIELYDPTSAAAAGAAAPAAANAAQPPAPGLINTQRPSSNGASSAAPALGLGAQVSQPTQPTGQPASQKRPRMMMHDELAAALDPTVYLSLDAAAGFEPEKRAKFHKACKDSGVTSVLDNTVSAAFGHQMVHPSPMANISTRSAADVPSPSPAARLLLETLASLKPSRGTPICSPCKRCGPPCSWLCTVTTRSPAPW